MFAINNFDSDTLNSHIRSQKTDHFLVSIPPSLSPHLLLYSPHHRRSRTQLIYVRCSCVNDERQIHSATGNTLLGVLK